MEQTARQTDRWPARQDNSRLHGSPCTASASATGAGAVVYRHTLLLYSATQCHFQTWTLTWPVEQVSYSDTSIKGSHDAEQLLCIMRSWQVAQRSCAGGGKVFLSTPMFIYKRKGTWGEGGRRRCYRNYYEKSALHWNIFLFLSLNIFILQWKNSVDSQTSD